MAKLPLTLACWDYDRTRPILDGRVQPEGIDLNPVCLPPEETFWRQVKHQEFDVSEFSLSYLTSLRSQGDWAYIGVPVFISRMFRHSCIYINTGLGITRPEDLAGKVAAVPGYQMTATVWMRGMLQHDYNLPPQRLNWVYSRDDIYKWNPPKDLRLDRIPQGKSLDGMLESGEIAALLTARRPPSFVKGSPKVARLFPDYRVAEEDYFRRTGLFPIMHTVIVRKEIQEQHPWVAQSLFKAFQEAKRLCYEDMQEAAALKYSLPWLLDEVQRTEKVMGKDFWPYGLEQNRHTIETLAQYSHEQGLSERLMRIEELFAGVTFDQYSIW
jgi:4,5-dihydroxyphthalate decarboxylase